MSSVPPVDPSRANVEGDVTRMRRRELEAKATRYAQLHGDADDATGADGAVRRAIHRMRAAIGRRK